MSGETYTNRHVEWLTVKRMDGSSVTGDNGLTGGASAAVRSRLTVGATYGLETQGGRGWGGRISGWNIDGEWIDRKSDQDIEREHREFCERIDREHAEHLAANRDEWRVRTAELPEWIRCRIENFLNRAGETFERDGWGYELCVAELAVLYDRTGCEDTDLTDDYAEKHGTSGNQHDIAKALARAHREGQTLAATVSALSPITGSAFYEPDPSSGVSR